MFNSVCGEPLFRLIRTETQCVELAVATWSSLAAKMRNDLASGNWRTKSYDIDGMQKEFFEPREFLRMLEYVENRAAIENSDNCTRVPMRSAER